MTRKCFLDRDNERVLLTDHPTIARGFAIDGLELVSASVARHFTMAPGSHPQARGFTFLLVNGLWSDGS